MLEIVPHLEVDAARMRSNLDATHGLIFAEAVTMALGKHVGKAEAHAVLEAASQQARATGQHLRAVLARNSAITERLSSTELDQLFAPENYLGVAEELVRRVVTASRQQK
jgi:3-carboxy-cis,cis-muconate cycloisomerase